MIISDEHYYSDKALVEDMQFSYSNDPKVKFHSKLIERNIKNHLRQIDRMLDRLNTNPTEEVRQRSIDSINRCRQCLIKYEYYKM
ncbi:hypothetical protein D3C87_75720 [compost metagenome]